MLFASVFLRDSSISIFQTSMKSQDWPHWSDVFSAGCLPFMKDLYTLGEDKEKQNKKFSVR